MVLRGKFLVAFQIELTLHVADRKDETELRPDANRLRLEAAHPVARAAAGIAICSNLICRPLSQRPNEQSCNENMHQRIPRVAQSLSSFA